MKISTWIKTASLVSLVWTTSQTVAETSPIIAGPQASATEIRAAHGAPTTEVRRLFFEQSGGYGEKASEMRLDLGADYFHFVQDNNDVIFDFKLRRHIVLDEAHQTFTNSSLYANVVFRIYEAKNRQMLSKVLTEAGVQANAVPMSPTDIEMQLGVSLPDMPSPQLDTKTDSDGAVHFSHEGKEIARVHFGSARLSESEKNTFIHFLHYGIWLHPQVVDAIARDGRIPDEMSYPTYKGYETKLTTLKLKSADVLAVDYPLPTSFLNDPMPDVKGTQAVLKGMVPIMLDAVARKASGGPRSIADYRNAIEAAFQKRDSLQVMTLALELSLHHGQNTFNSVADTVRAVSGDQQVQMLLKALSYKGANAADAVPYLRKIDRSRISDPYMVDIFLANDLGKSEEAVTLYANAIRGNPYVASFYKDFGDYWFNQYDMWDAWLLYDLARSLPDARDTPMLDAVDSLEHRLTTDFPQFF